MNAPIANPPGPAYPIRHRFASERGWLSFRWMGGALAFTTLSGLGIWLLPFSGLTQVSVVLHTALGAGVAVLFAVWQLSHWLATRKAPRTRRKVSAYLGFWLLAASIGSGFVITWQGLFGLFVNHAWSRVHLWTSILALPFLVYHFIPDRRTADFGPGRRRMWAAVAGVSSVLVAASVLCALAVRDTTTPRPRRASGQNLFAPGNVATEDGGLLATATLANSESCGVAGCHTAIYEEWRASAHRWSAEDEFFQTVRGVMTELHGTTVTEKCSGCHDPVSLLSGHKDPRLGLTAPGFREGDSCVVCHAVRKVDERGIGSYTLSVPKSYLYERSAASLARKVSGFLIRVYPEQHSRDFNLDPEQRPESCAPCHKEYDVIVEQQGPVQVETQYDDWKQGKWHTDRDPSQRLYCQQCHMYYLEPGDQALADPYDLKAGLGRKHRNHFFAAGNQYMPQALISPDAAGQVRRVNQWLRGEHTIPEIAKVWPRGPVVEISIAAPEPARLGRDLPVTLVLSNRKAGHSFPTGPLNIVRAWIELTVEDGAGREIFHSGSLDRENHIEAGSYVLKPIAIDLKGRMIMEPDLWHPEGPQYRPAIPAGQSASFDYRFRVPGSARGPLAIQARLRYRKANQFFMDSVYPRGHRTAPVTEVSSARAAISLAVEKP